VVLTFFCCCCSQVFDGHGTTIAELDNAGCCTGHSGTYIGQFEGFTFHDMKTVALYLILVDPAMYNEISG